MLTADMVHVRRRNGVLTVPPLDDEERERAVELAGAYLDIARAHVGIDRAAFLDTLRQVPSAAAERRLSVGLMKLVSDRCVFEESAPFDPAQLRRELFLHAGAARSALGPRETFDRQAAVRTVAEVHGIAPDVLDRGLYGDLPEAHVMRSFDAVSAEALVDGYELAQVQAVLLRAVRVVATVKSASPATVRALFRKLKFLRLLHRIEPLPRGGYAIDIDGPFSLFESVTKYGLQLALALPAVMACDEWAVEADLRWGGDRAPVSFRCKGRRAGNGGGNADGTDTHVPDDVAALLGRLRATEGPWRAEISSVLLDLPGIGTCVPDLELTHRTSGRRVFVEVLGYWSRAAVWKRIELVERGLAVPLVFAVAKHLRVSEDALGGDLPAALYVYPRTPNARTLLDRVEEVAGRLDGDPHRVPIPPRALAPGARRRRKPYLGAVGKARLR